MPQRQQLDEPFVIGHEPKPSTLLGAMRVLGHGAAYVGLTLLSVVLWLPMKLIGFVAVVGVIAEGAMAWTYIHERHDPFGAVMCVVMILAVLFVAGALVRFRTWLVLARQRWQ
jgi:hypothetical protein